MYQDSAGTTPVTAVGQPVGLRLDMRNAGVRGPELVTNGDGTDATGWTPTSCTFTSTNGEFVLSATGSGAKAARNIPTTVGSWYEISCTARSVTGGGWKSSLWAGTGASLFYTDSPSTTNTTLRGIFKATGTSTEVAVSIPGTTGGNVSAFDNISVRELPGNHATQSNTPNRPILQQDAGGRYYGADDGVDDNNAAAAGGGGTAGVFFCGAIQISGGAGTARTIWSDTGTNAGYRVRVNSSDQLELAAGNGTAFTTIATVATLPVGETHVVTAWDDGVNLNVQIDKGAVASVARPAVSAGTAGFTVGKDNGASSSFFNGRDYGMVYRKNSAPTATEIARTQRYLAAKAGIAL
jgi:hypothetical protein